MGLDKKTKGKIFWDLVVSLFIYALPMILMFLSFYVTGKKPWLNQPPKSSTTLIHR